MFDIDSYKELIRTIIFKNYYFARFDETVDINNKKHFYLRHDVDISPIQALTLGEVEFELNVRSNFFFQIGAETYNLFSNDNLNIIKSLMSMGHCVGLHIDEQIFGYDERKIYETLKWFSSNVTSIDYVVSFHRPSPSVLNKDFNLFVNTYSSSFYNNHYLSDSRRSSIFHSRVIEYLDEKINPIQLLLHPVWWYPEKDNHKLMQLIYKRNNQELGDYLKSNFNNVFGGFITNEDSSARL